MTDLYKNEGECLRCGHRWTENAAHPFYGCPKCGHPYIKWLNYSEELIERRKAAGR